MILEGTHHYGNTTFVEDRRFSVRTLMFSSETTPRFQSETPIDLHWRPYILTENPSFFFKEVFNISSISDSNTGYLVKRRYLRNLKAFILFSSVKRCFCLNTVELKRFKIYFLNETLFRGLKSIKLTLLSETLFLLELRTKSFIYEESCSYLQYLSRIQTLKISFIYD